MGAGGQASRSSKRLVDPTGQGAGGGQGADRVGPKRAQRL